MDVGMEWLVLEICYITGPGRSRKDFSIFVIQAVKGLVHMH